MINIDTWIDSYKVRVFDWIDEKNIYINIAYYTPGSNLTQSPTCERSFLIPLEESFKIRHMLHSVVHGLMKNN